MSFECEQYKSAENYNNALLFEECGKLFKEASALTPEQRKELISWCNDRVVSYRYSRDGEVLHRGFLCPSPIEDIVVGNCNRGREVKKTAANEKKITFEYGFSDQGLQIVRSPGGYIGTIDTECVFYSGDDQIGYLFNEENEICKVSKCSFKDGKLLSYLWAYIDFQREISQCKKEFYEYKDDKLYKATIHMNQLPLRYGNGYRHYEYIFEHDEEGYLSKYTVLEYINGSINTDNYWYNHWFKVHKKRRV